MRQSESNVFVFAVVGYKKTGKTRLVTQLVTEFKRRGLRVGTVKHDAHQFQMDHPGTDTYQHRAAGADVVAIASPDKWALQTWTEQPIRLQDLLALIRDVDVMVVEGFKQEDLPKIVIADETGAIFQNERLTNILAIVAEPDYAWLAPPGIDVYDKNDAAAIADHVLKSLG